MSVMIPAFVHINGRRESLSAATLSGLLEQRGIELTRGVAIALNGAVVPRARWAQTAVQAGDTVEIVRAMQGG